jgi:hypothetical protein
MHRLFWTHGLFCCFAGLVDEVFGIKDNMVEPVTPLLVFVPLVTRHWFARTQEFLTGGNSSWLSVCYVDIANLLRRKGSLRAKANLLSNH